MKDPFKRGKAGRGGIERVINQTGFTILEMVIVMAILSITAAVAGGFIYSILPDLYLRAAVRNLKSDMHMARLAAIRHNAFIVSEFSTVKNSYAIYVDNGGDDVKNANNYSQDPGETTIKLIQLHPQVNMYRAQFGSVAGRFAFNGRGTLDGLAGGVYMHNKMNKYRGVTISRIGKITIKPGVEK